MNHTTETIATLDTSLAPLRHRRHRRTCWVGRREGQRSMGPLAVVMLHEDLEDALKMLMVQEQQRVETFRANRAHKPLRDAIRLRRAKWRANDLEPVAAKHLVKTVGEFLVPGRESGSGTTLGGLLSTSLPRHH
jgi:hypothetical protein